MKYSACTCCSTAEVLTATMIMWGEADGCQGISTHTPPAHLTSQYSISMRQIHSCVLFIEEINPSRPHDVTSHNNTSLTFTKTTANVTYSSCDTWQIKLIMQQCPPPFCPKFYRNVCINFQASFHAIASSWYTSLILAPCLPAMKELITVKRN